MRLSGLLIVLSAVFMSGCLERSRLDEEVLPVEAVVFPQGVEGSGLKYHVGEIDGCQYLFYRASYGYWEVTHKGNCTNSIHRGIQ